MKGLFQCPPWARSFWAFSPNLNHMWNFSILTIRNFDLNSLKEEDVVFP